MSQPLLPWDSLKSTNHPQLVWRSQLNDRYIIEMQRTGGYSGKLFVFDHNQSDQEIFSVDVGLSYLAMFGPDMADVQEWQEKVLDLIDNTYNKQ